MKRVSVIIVHYDTPAELEKTVLSLRSAISDQDEIIVVNNGSRESILELQQDFPSLTVLQNSKNVGFAVAANQGASNAQGKYIWILNPDVTVQGNSLNALLRILESDDRVAVAGPQVTDSDGTAQPWCAGLDWTLGRILSRRSCLPKGKEPMGWVSGAAMLVKRSVFEGLDGFDKGFFLYFEDADLCKRIREAGYRIEYVPEAVVGHRSEKERVTRERKRLYDQSQDLYFAKHRSAFERKLLIILRTIYRWWKRDGYV